MSRITDRDHQQLRRMECPHTDYDFFFSIDGVNQSCGFVNENNPTSCGWSGWVLGELNWLNWCIMQHVEVRSVCCLLVKAIIAWASSIFAVKASSTLLDTSIIAIVQLFHNWYVSCFASFDEPHIRIRHITLEPNLKWSIRICRRIPSLKALIKSSIRVWWVEMSVLDITSIRIALEGIILDILDLPWWIVGRLHPSSTPDFPRKPNDHRHLLSLDHNTDH